jgi:hypothetical protein
MFEQDEIEYITEIIGSSNASKYAKVTLKRLYRIYDKYTEEKTDDCFCASTVRKIYYKKFMEWYESNS